MTRGDTGGSAKGRSRVGPYLGVIVLVGVVIAGAYFQEEIARFVHLRMWDRAAPGNVVSEFLSSARKRDQSSAARYLTGSKLQPMTKGGTWTGYRLASEAPGHGTDFPFTLLLPAADAKPVETQFVQQGAGAARVIMPDAKSGEITYRLEMTSGGWRISEISPGRPTW